MKKRTLLAIMSTLCLSFISWSTCEAVDEIYGCYKLENGQLRIVDNLAECLPSEGPITLIGDVTVAHEVNVNCNNDETVADALAQAPASGRFTINIIGVCQESITIERDDVTLRGASPGDGLAPVPSVWFILHLNGARRIQIQNLTLTGGSTGLNAASGATFEASDLRIIDASGAGIHLGSEASGTLSNSIIENCGRGIVTWGSGTLNVNGGEVKNSNSFSVQAAGKSYISLGGGFKVTGSTHHAVFATGGSIEINDAIVEDNHEIGVLAMEGASIGIQGSDTHIRRNNGGVTAWASSVTIREGVEITNNNYNGIAVRFGGHVSLGGGVTVAHNTHHGIIVGSNSTAMVNDSVIHNNHNHGIEIIAESYVFFEGEENQIINNGQWGINCSQDPPSSSQIWGNPGTVTDNPSGESNCPGY